MGGAHYKMFVAQRGDGTRDRMTATHTDGGARDNMLATPTCGGAPLRDGHTNAWRGTLCVGYPFTRHT